MNIKFLITPKPFGNYPSTLETFEEAHNICDRLNEGKLGVTYSVARIWTKEDERAWQSFQSNRR